MHTIGRDFIPPAEFISDGQGKWPITVYPNPFEEEARIRIEGFLEMIKAQKS